MKRPRPLALLALLMTIALYALLRWLDALEGPQHAPNALTCSPAADSTALRTCP